MRIRAHVRTALVADDYVIPVRGRDTCFGHLLREIQKRYEKWHKFPIYEFHVKRIGSSTSVTDVSATRALPIIDSSLNVRSYVNDLRTNGDGELFSSGTFLEVLAEETPASIERRAEDVRKALEERKRREEEERLKRELRLRRIAELSVKGECWELEGYHRSLDVPVEANGIVCINKGSLDQWCCIRAIRHARARGQYYFSVTILKDVETTNTWRFAVGVVATNFKPLGDKRWVGAHKGYSYIAGTGGKCHDTGKSSPYGAKFGAGDSVGCLLNFDSHTIEFFKNDVSQGVAFHNLSSPVFPAVSFTGRDSSVQWNRDYPPKIKGMMDKFHAEERKVRDRWTVISTHDFMTMALNEFNENSVNSWDAAFSARKDECLWYPDPGHVLSTVTNEGSDDKWRSCRTVGCYSSGVHFVEVRIHADAKTSNSWRCCIGCVPQHFRADNDRMWVGSQQSWGYIAGTGGKCYNSGQSTAYGEKYGVNDVVGVCMDFEKKEIEFYLNGDSQGVAFHNLTEPVHVAASMTATGEILQIRQSMPSLISQYRAESRKKREYIERMVKDLGNVWDGKKQTTHIRLDKSRTIAENAATKSKWSCVVSLLPYRIGRRYFEVEILHLGDSSNSWECVIGVVPDTFNLAHSSKVWVGAQKSWGYIGGTGGKCHDNGKSQKYGQKYKKGDKIGALLDFDNKVLQFFKNRVPQGDAFDNVIGPVYAAVSFTGKGSRVKLCGNVENDQQLMDELALYK